MKRREFLKSVTALAAGTALPAAPAIWSPAKAQSRQETLLIVSESGPNNLDIHGVGTTAARPSTSRRSGSSTALPSNDQWGAKRRAIRASWPRP